MSKEKKKPDLVVWDEERGYYSKELTYGSNIGAPSIHLEDVGGWKQMQAQKANKVFTKKYNELVVVPKLAVPLPTLGPKLIKVLEPVAPALPI